MLNKIGRGTHLINPAPDSVNTEGNRMENKRTAGHLTALFTIIIWGTTFISTKILLEDFKPVEILFTRFLIGFIVLFTACPHRLKNTTPKQELTFAAAGLCGVCLYYLMENIALTYSMASNVGVIVSSAPLFTALLSRLFLKDEGRLGAGLFIGFAAAMAGIAHIGFRGPEPSLNPRGDMLALLAALIWGFYSVFSKKISGWGFNVVLATRRTFFYGIMFMIPALAVFGFDPKIECFVKPENLFNIIYLGMGASALCFVTWNYAVRILGAVKTSLYIYVGPVITVIASALILKEKITGIAVIGTVLILAGLLLSSGKALFRKEEHK